MASSRSTNNNFGVLDLDNVDVPNVDFYTSIQDKLKTAGEEFSTFTQVLWGKEVSNFLDSTPGNAQMDRRWRPVRGLGKGGFGIVGLWQQIGSEGEVLDEIAIKETVRRPIATDFLQRYPSLAREAAIMQQLNDAEKGRDWKPNNILRLRDFKYFPSANRWRFYLEFASHGDLHKLIYNYRAWNTYLPEEFLWHVFHSLAKAAFIMDEGPFTDLETKKSTGWMVVHFDIKPANIYMAPPDRHARFPDYPTIKVADFGLAQLTGEDDELNPFFYLPYGTQGFKPPEQRLFTMRWQRRPDGNPHELTSDPNQNVEHLELNQAEPGYRFLSGHNVYGMGKVMYDLMTLSYPDALDEELSNFTTEERYYDEYEQHAIPVITTNKTPEYSASLRELIRECLNIDIGRRPTTEDLLDRTYRGLYIAMDSQSNPKVYFVGHEINHMPLGDADLSMYYDDWRNIKRRHWPDPVWQPLLSARWSPQVRRGDLVNQPIEEGGPKREVPLLHATVRRDTEAGRKVKWKFPSFDAKPDRRLQGRGGGGGGGDGGGDGDGNDDDDSDRRQEKEYQEALGRRLRASGPHDTRELNPRVEDNSDDAARRRREESEELARQRQRQQQAIDYFARAANEMVHPRLEPPLPSVIPPPMPPPGERPPIEQPPIEQPPIEQPPIEQPPIEQPPRDQPQPRRKRRRVLGLTVNDEDQEPEGRVIEGHNLRKRRR